MANEPVLIVDDNPTNLKLLKVIMTYEGYEVRTATDANEALQVLQEFHPALILMDIQLPGMDGLELTRKLRSNSIYENTVIIAVTAYAMKGDEEKTLAAGCNSYMSKPLDMKKLRSLVAEYFSKKGCST